MTEPASADARKAITLIIDRTWEQCTHALVEAALYQESEMSEVPSHITCWDRIKAEMDEAEDEGNILRELIKRAVSHWFTTSGAGREAWEGAAEDFNVGDLACELGDEDLARSLRLHGIARLTIETHSSQTRSDWTYDEKLITDEALRQLRRAAHKRKDKRAR